MAQDMPSLSLAIKILDHFHQLQLLGELLELCKEELNQAQGEKSFTRLGLLLDAYTSQADFHLHEIQVYGVHLHAGLSKLSEMINHDQANGSKP